MKKFMLEKSPMVYGWKDSNDCDEIDFNKYDMKNMGDCIPDAVFYWYVSGSYEGDGALIAIKDGRWYNKGLSHCSCFGPLEDFAKDISEYTQENLNTLLAAGTAEWQRSYAPLVELAKVHGYYAKER